MCKSSSGTNKKESSDKSNPADTNGAAQAIHEMPLNKEKDLSPSNLQPAVATDASVASTTPRRRCKRDKQQEWSKQRSSMSSASPSSKRIVKKKKKSNMTAKHQNDSKSGGIDAIIPSLIGVVILVIAIMAKMGFRGRATVAGIDLGTTNSVICVQAQEKGGELALERIKNVTLFPPFVFEKSPLNSLCSINARRPVGEIVCIPDPATNSPVVPSVVSFLDNHHLRNFRLTKEEKESIPALVPHPVDVVVGESAKHRINAHPHHTVYHAKRIIGREYNHESVNSLKEEVEFEVVSEDTAESNVAAFKVPYHLPPTSESTQPKSAVLTPSEIGSYIINHLRTMTRNHLGHNNIQSAVIAIPAKFEPSQRDATIRAFELAGLKVARILEEPTAAALAYGLHKRDDVHYVMVYDFGGGTLDISLLYIGEGGFIEVLGSEGDEQLGGADFDAAVAHWLLEKRGGNSVVDVVAKSVEAIGKRLLSETANSNESYVLDVEDVIEEVCPKLKEIPLCTASSLHTLGERMKIALSNGPSNEDAIAKETCFGLSSISDTAQVLCNQVTPIKFSLTLKEYDLAVDHLYKRSLYPIQRILKDLNLKKEEIDEVVMVGGTTRMPQIRELVRLELGKERLNTHIDPDLTVAYGAASVID
jgi:molecular chaperone DnaK (HSP70)